MLTNERRVLSVDQIIYLATLEDLLTVEAHKGLQLFLHCIEELIDKHQVIRLTNEKRVLSDQ